jgi:thiol:disulfide interchange protein
MRFALGRHTSSTKAAQANNNNASRLSSAATGPGTPGGSGAVLSISADELKALLAREKLPILLDIYAEWCGPCKMMGDELNKVAKE